MWGQSEKDSAGPSDQLFSSTSTTDEKTPSDFALIRQQPIAGSGGQIFADEFGTIFVALVCSFRTAPAGDAGVKPCPWRGS